MAEIRPFRALEYNARRLPLDRVLTQPYDKITPEMLARYLTKHPNNLARILRPLDQPEPAPGISPYQRAAETLAAWRRDGIIQQKKEAALFAYYQTFRVPGDSGVVTRKGFVGLTRLADYGEGVVFPHERTLSGPREDRLELLRHTRTHFGQVFLLYSDPEARTEALVEDAIGSRVPVRVRDEYEVEHSLWPITSPKSVNAIASTMADRRVLIADGHHRYETALRFRDEQRRSSRGGSGNSSAEWLMTTLVNMDSPGLVVLPTHRVLVNLGSFDAGDLLARIQEFFELHEVGTQGGVVTLLRQQGRDRRALGLVVADREVLLLLRSDTDLSAVLPDVSSRQRELDVVLLHRLVLERCLGISESDLGRERYIRYVREAETAIADVREKRAQASFLLNPTPADRVRDIAFSGETLPQKSTDFFPKLLSGLVMYTLD